MPEWETECLMVKHGKNSQIGIVLIIAAALALAGVIPTVPAARAQDSGFTLESFASGFTRPLYVTHAGDGSGRLFVVEQGGMIWVLQDGQQLDTPFLDVSDRVSPEALGSGYSERGLLGLAFHPNYAENGVFFINYTDRNGTSVTSRFSVSADDPNVADAASEEQLLMVEQPFANHNGGHLAFGPDGYLYLALGDGGSGGDPQNNAQNLSTLLGTILRLDVDADEGYAIPDDNPFVAQDDARPEIWAWGLRNPWRFSFDRETGDLYIADVGQNEWEEVNFQPASSPGGENYGWNPYEGSPFGSLLIALRDAKWILGHDDAVLDAMREAYLGAWGDLAPVERLGEAAAISFRLAALGRALSWWSVLNYADDAYRDENWDAVAYWLLTFLNNTPLE